MIDYVINAVAEIHRYMGPESGKICLLTGDKGVGKSTIAKEYCKIYKNANVLEFSDEFSLAACLCGNKFKKKYDKYSCIFAPLLKIIKYKRLKLIFLDIGRDACATILSIIQEIYMIIVRRKISVNIVVLMDNPAYHSFQHFLEEFPQLIYLPPLKKWEYDDFLQLTNELYPGAALSEEIVKLLSEYSIGNPGIFLWHIMHLKSLYFIRYDGRQFETNSPEEIRDILEEGYSDIVKRKYEMLPPDLQTIIKETSSIGFYFHTQTLKEVFNIKNARLIIDRIEKLSMLLLYTDMKKNTGRFVSESAHIQIEELIEADQLTTWCDALGHYFEGKINPTLSIVEKIQFKEKCILYFIKSKNIDRIIFHCLSLVPLKCALSQYESAITTVGTMKEFSGERVKYKKVNTYCYLLFAIIYKSMARFADALKNLNEFSRRSGSKTVYIRELEAELIYNLGDIEKSYDMLKKMYRIKSDIDDPYLSFNIVSMLSSVEETLGYSSYIKHFNQAIAIAKNSGLSVAYYKMLRKANIAHFGENGIRLMKEAESYFEKNRIYPELMMTQHNIGTEAMFREKTFNYSLKYLCSAYKIAEEMGFCELGYIQNSLAVYKIFKGEYKVALKILCGFSLEYEEDFTKLAVYLNKVTCLRILGFYEKAWETLNLAKEINSDDKNCFPFYTMQIILQEAYFYLEEGLFQDAYSALLEYFNQDYEDRVENIVSAKLVLSELCEKNNLPTPGELSGFSKDIDKISRTAAENRLVLCELMFWE